MNETNLTLSDFVQSLNLIRLPVNRKTLGLVKNKTSNISFEDVLQEFPNCTVVSTDAIVSKEELITLLHTAFDQGHWLVLTLSNQTLSSFWLEQLDRLKNSNKFFIQTESVENSFFGELPESTQVVVYGSSSVIDEMPPEFLSLFGPIIEL